MRQGFFSVQQTCPHCRGTGKIIPEPCTTCHGQGKIKKQKTLEVKIPAGIDAACASQRRQRRAGHQWRPAGRPVHRDPPEKARHLRARRRRPALPGADQLHTAALGGEIEVPTLAGKAAIDIPEGTQAGKQFRLRGKGIKGVRSSYPGDLYCHISGGNAGQADRAPAQAAQGAGRVAEKRRLDKPLAPGEQLDGQAQALFQRLMHGRTEPPRPWRAHAVLNRTLKTAFAVRPGKAGESAWCPASRAGG
jgi:hypothetical protein